MPLTMTVVVPYWLLTTNEHIVLAWPLRTVGVLLFLASFALFAVTLWLFILIGRGTLAPWNATKRLVVKGPYRYCRNPMISGVLGMILGEALFFGSGALLMWGILFFTVNTIYFIAVEEPNLQKKFSKSYLDYKQHVPRWVPRLRPWG